MNITSTRSRAASHLTQTTPRERAQAAYQDAKEEMQQATDAYFSASRRKEDLTSRNAIIGTVVGVGLGIAALTITGTPFSHYSLLAAPGMLGMVAGGMGTRFVLNKGIQKELQPKFQEGWQNLVTTRETYREELLKELNDEGVREITQPRWDARKDSYYTRTIVEMNEQVDQLTRLADARKSETWVGDLARTEDDPAAFQIQEQFVADNPSLKDVLDKKC